MMKTVKIISVIVFIATTAFFGIWAYRSNLSFDGFGTYFGAIGSLASIIGLLISIYTLSISKGINPKEKERLISVKKNVVERSSFGNIKGNLKIGDTLNNDEKDN